MPLPRAEQVTRSMQIRCPHCQDPIKVVQDEVSFDCPSCGKSVQLADAQTIVQPVESAPTSDTATLALDGGILPPAIGETGGEQVHYSGDYELLEEIARGGMGVVYKARQISLNRTVAVKMILAGQLAGEEDVRRFLTEAEAAANLQHPHIVAIHEVGEHKGQHFFSMDYVEGTDLSALIRDNPLPAREAADYVQRIASAIQYAHEQGTLHRDLKPSNILIDGNGEPHITDFGIAKRIESDADDTEVSSDTGDSGRTGQQQEVAQLTATGAVLGTPSYMPPEQAGANQSDIGPHSDVYSMGAILYCLLTGRPPFQAENPLSTMLQVLQQEPVSPRLLNTNVHRDLETICLKCLEKDPGRRYETAQALVDELNHYLDGEPIQARPISKLERGWRWCKRKPAAAGMWALAMVLLLTLSIVGPIVAMQQADNARKQVELLEQSKKAKEAETRLRKATESALKTAQRRTYCSDMLFAQRLWEERNIGALRKLLEEYRARDDLKGFEWNYLNRLVNGDLLIQHSKFVNSVRFSRDGKRIVSGSRDKTVKVCDARTGREILTLIGHTKPVNSVSFSPDGKWLASAGDDETVRVWDSATGQVVLTFKGHSGAVNSVSFSPDGKRIVSGSWDKTAKVWDANTGQEVLTLKGHSSIVNSVCFSPDGKQIVSGSADKTVKVWDAESGQQKLALIGHSDWVRSVVFSPGGKRIVSGSWDKTVKLWDANTGQEMLTLKGHSSRVSSVDFSPDGKRIISGSHDTTVKVWDAETGQEILTLIGHSSVVRSVSFSPDGKRFVSGSWDRTAKVWNSLTAQEPLTLKGHSQPVQSVAFSPDARRIFTASTDKTVKLWDVETGQKLFSLIEHVGLRFSMSLSPDGKRIIGTCADKTMKVWDVKTGEETLALKGQSGVARCLSFSPDGKRIVSVVHNTVTVWDAINGQELLTLKGHSISVQSVSFSPDGKRIISGSDDRTVKVWDANTGREMLTLRGHSNSVKSVGFSPDGKQIVSGSTDKTLKVWDAESGQETLTLKGHSGFVDSVSFSPDGKRIVSGSYSDKTVKVWDVETGQVTLTLGGDSGNVTCVSFSPDGSRIVSGGLTVKIWDAGPLAKSK